MCVYMCMRACVCVCVCVCVEEQGNTFITNIFYTNYNPVISSTGVPPSQPFASHLHPPPPSSAATPPTAVLPTSGADDDFADFQAAPAPAVKAPQIPAPVTVNSQQTVNSTVTRTGMHVVGASPCLCVVFQCHLPVGLFSCGYGKCHGHDNML